MKPGSDLDQLIAEKIFGKTQFEFIFNRPYYSTDMSAAWLIVEKLGVAGFRLTAYPELRNYRADFLGYEIVVTECAPHAICLAALKTLKVKDTSNV